MIALNRKLLYLAIPILVLGVVAYFWKSSFDNYLALGIYDVSNLKLYSQAEKNFRIASSLMPFSGEAYYWLGVSLQEQSKNEEALEAFNKALSLASPNDFLLHYNLGVAFHNLKNYPVAEKEYRQALSLNPNDGSLNRRLTFLIKEMGGDPEEALKFAEKLTEIEPNNSFSWLTLADVYRYAKKFDEALRAAEKAIEIAPNNCLTMASKIQTFIVSEKYSEVVEIADTIIENSSNEPDCLAIAHYAKGQFFESKKLIPEAISAYEQVVSLVDPEVNKSLDTAKEKARERIEFLEANK